jgi:hypothetical protein
MMTNQIEALGKTAADRWAPRLSVFQIQNKTQNDLSCRKNSWEVRKILWMQEIQFRTLFINATSSKSPRILNSSKDSESKLS